MWSSIVGAAVRFAAALSRRFRVLRDETGASAIEYGLIAGLIAVVIIGAVTLAGSNLEGVFDRIATDLGAALSSD